MYWFPKMYKTPNRARFTLASRKDTTSALSKTVTKDFKLIFKQTQKFHIFHSDYKTFWVVENSKPVIARLDQINTIQNAKLILVYFTLNYHKKIC